MEEVKVTMQDIENSLGEEMSLSSTQGNDEVNKLRAAVADKQETEAADAMTSEQLSRAVTLGNSLEATQYAQPRKMPPLHRKYDKIGRNDLCPCGSGKKYKDCCLNSKQYEGYTYGDSKNPYDKDAENAS